MPTLLAHSAGPDIPLDRGAVMIGRHPECDVLLDSLRVSRRHCVLSADGEAVVVRDLGSTNGTWVNGRRVQRERLKPGDKVSIAHIRYRLEATSACHASASKSADCSTPLPRRSGLRVTRRDSQLHMRR